MIPGHDRRDDSSGWLYMALGFSVLGLIFGLAMVTRILGPASIPIWGASFLAMIFIANGPVGKAIGRRIAGELPESPQPAEVSEAVYAELDELRARMIEMEERQDFSERLLASRNEVTGQSDRGGQP
jgi:hypothetical protein